jgi:hypothetical protein
MTNQMITNQKGGGSDDQTDVNQSEGGKSDDQPDDNQPEEGKVMTNQEK